MGSLKISKKNKDDFKRDLEKVLGRFWKRASVVHRNYGDIFSVYIKDVLRFCSLNCFPDYHERASPN